MSQRDLLNEAQFRTLELDSEDKKYLVEVLVINDKAYFELIEMLGDPLEAVEFALGEVKQHNKELRQEQAAAVKAAAERTKRERKEALKVQQQAKREVQEKKRQEEREKTGKLAPKKKKVEKVKEEKHAVEAPKQERKRKRKISQGADDSGYFSKSSSPPETGKKDDEVSLKGNKRARSNDDDDEDKTPTKKAKSSKPPQSPMASRTIKPKRKPAALPRTMQAGANKTSSGKDKDVEMSDQVDSDVVIPAKPVKKTTKKTARVDARNTDPPQVSKRRTRSTCVVENEEDEDMEDTDEDAEDDDAFVVDDGYKSTRKSRPKAKEVQKFFSGMR
ncbi:hypothetical protein AA0114_g7566 [Alternaria tenuissima]|uniref:Uncharacterized protein n=1 Tax=Alternaria tenuissima TaxID=119927 RepID=A0A4Q4MD76_9PLEO|nr:hypothetical protein AA0114_g7566 [Alternaria tenuissima]